MRYYAIRHKPTGFFMPQHSIKKQGFTWDNPVSPTAIPPRLFTREQDAKTSLTWWLKGITSRLFVRGDGFTTDDDEVWSTTPLTERDYAIGFMERRAEDMEVVPVVLEISPA